MLENITEKLGGIIRSLSGKSKITEKNIEETIEQIKARYKSQELTRKRHQIQELKEVYGEDEEDLIW